MNKKLQGLTEEFSREIRARLPDVRLEIHPHGRKSAYIYMIAPDRNFWENQRVLDILDRMAEMQINTLVDTGYSIHLLPDYPVASLSEADLTAMREQIATYEVRPAEDRGRIPEGER